MDFLFSALRVIGILFMVLMVFNLMIVVHEWGHFLAGRWRGLKIEKFQIWFGKPIWKKTINGVQYGLGCLPLGGFVALPQMAPMDAIEGSSDDREQLPPITPLDKIIVAFAGPLFSFLLACIFAVIVSFAGKPEMESNATQVIGYVKADSPAEKAGLKPGDKVLSIDGKPIRSFRGPIDSVVWNIVSSESDHLIFVVDRPGQGQLTIPVDAEKPAPEKDAPWWKGIFSRPAFRQAGIAGRETVLVGEIIPNSPAASAGVQKGDVILSINGETIFTPQSYFEYVRAHQNEVLKLEIQRGDARQTVQTTPSMPDVRPKDWEHKDIGIMLELKRSLVFPNPVSQIADAGRTMWNTLSAIASPKSDVKASHLSSAIGIVHVYMTLFEDPDGWRLVLWFSVVLNVNLAILNLLPFPVLDGGHITMAILETIRRRPLNIRVLEIVQSACVLLLLGFMGFLMLKDTGDWTGLGARASKDAPKQEKAEEPVRIQWNPTSAAQK